VFVRKSYDSLDVRKISSNFLLVFPPQVLPHYFFLFFSKNSSKKLSPRLFPPGARPKPTRVTCHVSRSPPLPPSFLFPVYFPHSCSWQHTHGCSCLVVLYCSLLYSSR
jgi:hypothetical protein